MKKSKLYENLRSQFVISSIYLMFSFMFVSTAHAGIRNAVYTGRAIDINVSTGKITEVVFPEKVAKIIKGGEADSVMIEVLDYSVYVLPKKPFPADIFVISVTGTSYPVNLVMGHGLDTKVKVSYSFEQNKGLNNRNYTVDLIKVMMQGRVPAGASIIEGQEQTLIHNQQIKLKLDTIFELPQFKGFVMTAENLMDHAVIIPIQQIGFSNLLAISSGQDILGPQGKQGSRTKVYMVVAKTLE